MLLGPRRHARRPLSDHVLYVAVAPSVRAELRSTELDVPVVGAGGGASSGVKSEKTMFSCDPCQSSASWTLGPPPTRAHAHAPSACARLLGFAWIQRVRKWQGPRCRGSWKQGASAWRRTIIVEVSHFAPPVTGAIKAASMTTETASAAHAARLRRVLTKRHALPTINRGSCSARENGHHQAFAGPQDLVGWR